MAFASSTMAMAMQTGGALTSAFGAMGAAKAANQQRQFAYDMGGLNAQSQKQTLLYQNDVANLNAQHAQFTGDTNQRIAELGAQSALNQGQQQVAGFTLKAGQIKSSQRASMAANGIDLGVGNAAEIQASTDIMTEIDRNTIEANAVRSAWGYRMEGTTAKNAGDQQALNYRTDAAMRKVAADNTYRPMRGVDTNPGMAGALSLVGSAGQVAQSWYAMNKTTKG